MKKKLQTDTIKISKTYRQASLKKDGEWRKNRNERENMYTNKPKWSHKEM